LEVEEIEEAGRRLKVVHHYGRESFFRFLRSSIVDRIIRSNQMVGMDFSHRGVVQKLL